MIFTKMQKKLTKDAAVYIDVKLFFKVTFLLLFKGLELKFLIN